MDLWTSDDVAAMSVGDEWFSVEENAVREPVVRRYCVLRITEKFIVYFRKGGAPVRVSKARAPLDLPPRASAEDVTAACAQGTQMQLSRRLHNVEWRACSIGVLRRVCAILDEAEHQQPVFPVASDPVLCDSCEAEAVAVSTSGAPESRRARCADCRVLGGSRWTGLGMIRLANNWIRDPGKDLDRDVMPEVRRRNA